MFQTLSRPSGCPKHNCWLVVLGQTGVGLSRRAPYTAHCHWPPRLLLSGATSRRVVGGQIGKLRLFLGTISRGSVHYRAKLMLFICYPIFPYLEIEIFAHLLHLEISNNVFPPSYICALCAVNSWMRKFFLQMSKFTRVTHLPQKINNCFHNHFSMAFHRMVECIFLTINSNFLYNFTFVMWSNFHYINMSGE